MVKIGIAPTHHDDDRPFFNDFSIIYNYPKRVKENGAVPVGLLFPCGFDEEVLEGIDGFIIPGGVVIRDYHLLLIHYCFMNKKPLLGICMGLQAIGIYDSIKRRIINDKKEVNYETLLDYFNSSKEEDLLINVEGHTTEFEDYDNIVNNSSHNVLLDVSSRLYKIYKKNKINEPSVHHYALNSIGDDFLVNALSEDMVIEGAEYKGDLFIMGLQFHPEMEDKNDILFKCFIDECEKYEII